MTSILYFEQNGKTKCNFCIRKENNKNIKRALISERYSGIAEDIKALFMYKGSFG